jgi:hypothetical protein
MKPFNFNTPIAYVPHANKVRWHNAARRQLKALALALGLDPGTYEVRRNYGGIAVSGEATLHGEHVYIQASQPYAGSVKTGILFRRCNGRRDYTGERNHFASLDLLNDSEALATKIEDALGPCYKYNATEVQNRD